MCGCICRIRLVSGKKGGDILKYLRGVLVSHSFIKHQWKEMSQPLKLRKMNELMYKTRLVGKKYTATEMYCQLFTKEMYRLAS